MFTRSNHYPTTLIALITSPLSHYDQLCLVKEKDSSVHARACVWRDCAVCLTHPPLPLALTSYDCPWKTSFRTLHLTQMMPATPMHEIALFCPDPRPRTRKPFL